MKTEMKTEMETEMKAERVRINISSEIDINQEIFFIGQTNNYYKYFKINNDKMKLLDCIRTSHKIDSDRSKRIK